MIAIMQVDSIDIIDLTDTDNTNLRFIPSNRINLTRDDLSFYKILFTQDVTAKEEPDPSEYIHKSDLPKYFWNFIQNCIAEDTFPTEEMLNPDNFILKSQMPLYYWNFSKYALSKPANIAPNNYYNLCNLLQAIPQLMNNSKVYNWTSTPNNYFWLGYNQSASITADGYFFKNGQSLITLNKINPRTDIFSIKAIVQFTANNTQTVVNFYNPNNSTDSNFFSLSRIANGIRFLTSQSTLSSSIQITLPSNHNINHPVTLTLTSEPNKYIDNTVCVYLKAEYIYNDFNRTFDFETADIPFNRFYTNLLERINTQIRKYQGATVNTTISGNKTFLEYEFHNETTGDQTIIKFDDSKIINDKLLVIA